MARKRQHGRPQRDTQGNYVYGMGDMLEEEPEEPQEPVYSDLE